MNFRPCLKSEFSTFLKPDQFMAEMSQYIEQPLGILQYLASEKPYQGVIANNKFSLTATGIQIDGQIEETATGSRVKLKYTSTSTFLHALGIGLFLLAIIVIIIVAYFEGFERIKLLKALLLFFPSALICLCIATVLDGNRTKTMKFLVEHMKD